MNISRESLSHFKTLYEQEFGTLNKLQEDDYERLARKILNLYKMTYGEVLS